MERCLHKGGCSGVGAPLWPGFGDVQVQLARRSSTTQSPSQLLRAMPCGSTPAAQERHQQIAGLQQQLIDLQQQLVAANEALLNLPPRHRSGSGNLAGSQRA